MNALTSIQLRPIVAELAAAREDAGKVSADAEHKHRLTVRRSILSGSYDEPEATAAAVETARQALAQAKIAHDEAAGLLAEALANERAAEEAAIRGELADMVSHLSTTAGEADEALAVYVGKIRAAVHAESDARLLCESGLGKSAHGVVGVMRDAVGDAITFLQSVRSGNPADFGPFAAERAKVGVQRIKGAAGL